MLCQTDLYWSQVLDREVRSEQRRLKKMDSVENKWFSNSEGSVCVTSVSLRTVYEGIAEVYDTYTADSFFRNF